MDNLLKFVNDAKKSRMKEIKDESSMEEEAFRR
jgi:hypothetical protein